MPVENVTANRGYELPDLSNDLDFDVFRLINALTAIDLDVASAFTELAGKSDLGHVHAIADVTGLQSALDGKSDVGHTHTLNGLSNVDAPTPGTNHVLRFDGTSWSSGALDAGWITLGTVAEARLPSWLSQANIDGKVVRSGDTFSGNVFVSKAQPIFGIVDGADQMRMTVQSGIAHLQAPEAAGKLYLASMFGSDLSELRARFGGAYRDILHSGNGIEGVSVRLHGASGDGVTDDTAAIQSAQSAAASAKLPLIVPPGSYLYNGTVYTVSDLSIWIDSGFTGGVNPMDSLQKNAILITAETPNTTPNNNADSRVALGITVAAKGSQHASGVRANLNNHSDDGQGCTAVYGRATNDLGANWGAALHGETRHAGGTSISISAEAASYATGGQFYGLVVNNTTNGAEATHPITGAAKIAHPLATAILLQGSNDVDPMGAWFKGIHFAPDALRSNAIAIHGEAPVQNHLRVAPTAAASEADIFLLADSLNGIVLQGTYGSGNAIRVPGDQAVAFENTGAKKLRWSTTLSRFELVEGNLQLSKVQPAMWFVDGASDARMRLAGGSLIFERDQAAAAEDFANWRFERAADYTGAGSGGVSSNVRIFTDVGANAGDGTTIEPEWALNTRIDSASAYVNAVAVSGQARRDAAGAVWAGHFNTIDNTNPTATKASRAIEANIQADGGDSQNLRTVVDVIAHNRAMAYGAGADNIARGVRVVADTADFKQGLEFDAFSGKFTENLIHMKAPALRGLYSTAAHSTADMMFTGASARGIALDGAYTSGIALRVASDQKIAFRIGEDKTLHWDSVAAAFKFTGGAVSADSYRDGNDLPVVGPRVTGWEAPTGTASRTTFDTATVTLEFLARRVKALVDDLMGHGLIGT